jgi:hypothetical protein
MPKNKVAADSWLYELMLQYNIEIEVLSGSKKRAYLRKSSRWNYIYLSFIS